MKTMTAEVIEPGQGGGEAAKPYTNVPKSFLTFLSEQSGGAVVQELSEELRDLVEQIENTHSRYGGKVQGHVELKIKFVLERGVYKVTTDYTIKKPKAPVAETPMWLQGDGSLATTNPKQLTMPFGRPQVVP